MAAMAVLCAALLLLGGCAAMQQRAAAPGGKALEQAGAGNVAAQAEVEALREAMVGVVNKVDESRRENDDWSLRLAIGGVVAAPLIYPAGKLLWLLLPALSRRMVGRKAT